MHTQDLFAALDVGVGHGHLAVKTARTQQRGVQNVAAVGGRKDDHAFICLETVHLDQQLVEGLFTFVVATAVTGTTRTANGINLVDEDDAGRVFLGLFEHVAHTAGTDTHEHFHEVGPRDGEEGHTRLARDGARQQRLTGTRRAHQQRAFGDFAAKTAEFLRVAQEFDDLFQFFLGLVDAGHVVKGHAAMLFGQQLGLGLAKAHGATFATTLHPVHEIDPDTDQQQEGKKRQDEGLEARLLLTFGRHRHVVGNQKVRDLCILGLDRHVIASIGAAIADLLTVQRRPADLLVFHGPDKFRIADILALQGVSGSAEQVEKGQYQQEQNDPESDVSRVAQGMSPTNLAARGKMRRTIAVK